MGVPSKLLDDAALEIAVDEVIAECDGDPRAAIRALLIANAFLEQARDQALDLVSTGYARGKTRRRKTEQS